MYRFRALPIILSLLVAAPVSVSCIQQTETLNPQEKAKFHAERALLVTSVVITEAHKSLWSDPLRKRASECRTESNPKQCMGAFTPDTNQKILASLEIYAAHSRLAGSLILKGEGAKSEELSKIVKESVAAGLKVLAVIPGADKYVTTLEDLLEVL